MATTTTVINSATPAHHTMTSNNVAVVITGQFNGASIRVGQVYGSASPETVQWLPNDDGGLVTEPKAFTCSAGSDTVMVFQAISIGSPVPSIRVTSTDA